MCSKLNETKKITASLMAFVRLMFLFILGIWLDAEKMVRDLSVTYSYVYVISGSIFDENADGRRDEDGKITQ